MGPQYPGDVIAADLLARLDSHHSLNEIKALLGGVLLGHAQVPPSVVLDEIEFGAIDQPHFKDIEQAQSFMSMFMGLWNEIAQ